MMISIPEGTIAVTRCKIRELYVVRAVLKGKGTFLYGKPLPQDVAERKACEMALSHGARIAEDSNWVISR